MISSSSTRQILFSALPTTAFRSLSTSSSSSPSPPLSPELFEEAISEANLHATLDRLKNIRLGGKLIPQKAGEKAASIFIPFTHHPLTSAPSILFTRRSFKLNKHRGEVCFPGGFEETADRGDLVEAAVRETLEEIVGLRREDITVVGTLPPIQFNTFPLHQVLGYVRISAEQWPLAVNEDEVDSVHLVPLETLVKAENWRRTVFSHGWTTPVFLDVTTSPGALEGEERHPRIWGMTSSLLYVTMASLMPETFHFDFECLWRSRGLRSGVSSGEMRST